MHKPQHSDSNKRSGKSVASGFIFSVIVVMLVAFILFPRIVMAENETKRELTPISKNGDLVVGTDIVIEDITQFYYTYATSTYPPKYQRYRFYIKDGKYFFYHEKREGNHFPLGEADITVSGSIELSGEQWAAFFGHLKGGAVEKRKERTESGGSGPWLFLYWKGDRSKYQEFSFVSKGTQISFEELCAKLKNSQ